MGIKDICYAALFDKKDLPFLYRYAAKVRTTHSQQLVDDFNNACQRKVDDHNPILGDNIEFIQVAKADDLTVTAGLTRLMLQITGGSTVRWQYLGKGLTGTAPAAGNTALAGELTPRVDMSLFGWREYASTSLRYLGIFGEDEGTSTILEAGIFDAATAGTMLNRNVFNTLSIVHTFHVTGYVISSIIEFVPMM